MKTVYIKYFDPKIPVIDKIKVGDWIDLRIRDVVGEDKVSKFMFEDNIYCGHGPGEFLKIYLGIGMILPHNYEAHILPRSSTFKHTGLIQVNSMGIIDNSYNGNDDEWFVPMYALKGGSLIRYERIVQFRIIERMPELIVRTVETLNTESRGGFGSTGRK